MKQPQHQEQDEARGGLLGMLEDKQKEVGYVPEEYMLEVAESLDIPVGEVYGVATFYSFMSTEPKGRNIIRVCKGVPCDLQNYSIVAGAIERELGIAPGETTPDGRFSLELVNCIGACDEAPAMLVNNDLYGKLTPKKIVQILRSYK